MLVFGLPRDFCICSYQSNTSLSVKTAGWILSYHFCKQAEHAIHCTSSLYPGATAEKQPPASGTPPHIYNKHWLSDESSKYPQWWQGQPSSTKQPLSTEKVTLSSWTEQGGAPREVQRPVLRACTAIFQILWSIHVAKKVRLLFPTHFTELVAQASQCCTLQTSLKKKLKNLKSFPFPHKGSNFVSKSKTVWLKHACYLKVWILLLLYLCVGVQKKMKYLH